MLTLNKYILPSILLSFCSIVQAYEIDSCEDLQNISHWNGEYYLVQDIDCHGFEFYPISGAFAGTLDGQGYTISNLQIGPRSALGNEGLFSIIESAKIMNIHFYNADLQGSASTNRGLIAGYADNAEISNITVDTLDVLGGDSNIGSAGGIIGFAENSTLSKVHLYSRVDEKGVQIARGEYAGGLIGTANLGTTISNSSVSQLHSLVHSCEYNCAFGGLIGAINETNDAAEKISISTSSAKGLIEVGYRGGGLVGIVAPYAHLDITDSYTIVKIEAYESYAGGIIGRAAEDANAPRGNITLKNVYAAGKIDAAGSDGGRGIVGNKDQISPRVKSIGSFFDKNTTGKDYSGDRYTDEATGKDYESKAANTATMTNPQTFIDAGWSTEIWDLALDGHYPTLK